MNITDADGYVGWIMQIVGTLVLHSLLTCCFLFGAYFLVRITVIDPSWFMIALSIIVCAVSLMGIAAIIIDICNIVFLVHEIKSSKK